MKKLTPIAALAAACLMATSAQAFELSESFINVGVTENQLNALDFDNSGNLGFALESSRLYKPDPQSPLRLGWSSSFNYVLLSPLADVNLDDDGLFNVDFLAVGAYSFKENNDIPAILFAGAGYGFGLIGSIPTNGFVYKVGGKFDFSDNIGVTAEYRHISLGFDSIYDETSFGDGMDTLGLYLSINF